MSSQCEYTNCEDINCHCLFFFFHFSLSASPHRPSSLISVRLFTHGRHSPTECLLTASLSSCWSMSCTLWCLRLCATAATHSLPSSSGQLQIRRLNDRVERECQGCQGCLNKRLKYLQSTALCLHLLAVTIFGEGTDC